MARFAIHADPGRCRFACRMLFHICSRPERATRSPWRVPSRANLSPLSTGLGSAISIAQGMFKTQWVFVSLFLFGIMGADLFYLVELVEAATTSALTGKSRRPRFFTMVERGSHRSDSAYYSAGSRRKQPRLGGG